MAIKLTKLGINLTEQLKGSKEVLLEIGWAKDEKYKVDSSAFLLTDHRKVKDEDDFIFYGRVKNINGSVSLAKESEGFQTSNCEQISVDFSKLDADIESIIIASTVYEGEKNRNSLGDIGNGYFGIFNKDTNEEILFLDIEDDEIKEDSVILVEFYKDGYDWNVKSVEQGVSGGIEALIEVYGLKLI